MVTREVSDTKYRVNRLAERMRREDAARVQTRCRRIGPGSLTHTISYQLHAQPQPAEGKIRALLLPMNRSKLLEELLAQLSETQAAAIKFTRCEQGLIAYLSDGELPDLIGAMTLRAIDAEGGVILVPRDLILKPKISDRELAALLLSDQKFGLLLISQGQLHYQAIVESGFKSLLEMIRSPFINAEKTPLTVAQTEFYGARLRAVTPMPLPQVQQAISLSESADGTELINRLTKLSWWQRLKNFFTGNSVQQPATIESTVEQRSMAQPSEREPDNPSVVNAPAWWQRLKGWWQGQNNQPLEINEKNATRFRWQGLPDAPVESRFKRWKDQVMAKLSLETLRRVGWLRRILINNHTEHLLDMMELFNQGKFEEAFRRAIPLSDDNEEPKNRTPRISFGIPKPRLNLDFKLLELFARGNSYSVTPVGEDSYEILKRQYEHGAQIFLDQKNYRAAAYVYAHLLHNYQRAAQALSRGGYHREAAVLYLEKLKNPILAAQELAAGGDYERAAELAIEAHNYKLAVSFYRTINDEAEARRCLEMWVIYALANGNFEQAITILEDELSDYRRAVELLIDLYPTKLTDSRISIGMHAVNLLCNLDARDEALALIRRMRRDLRDNQVVGNEGSGTACASLLTYGHELMRLERRVDKAGRVGLGMIREGWRASAEAAAGFARAGYHQQTTRALDILREFARNSSDPLLIADTERACAQLTVYTPSAVNGPEATPVMPQTGGVAATALRCPILDVLMIGRGDGRIEWRQVGSKLQLESMPRNNIIGPYRYAVTGLALGSTEKDIYRSQISDYRLVALGVDGVITVWSVNGDLLSDFRDPAAPYTVLCPMSINSRIIVGNAKGGISVIDLNTSKVIAQVEQEGVISAIAYDPQLEMVACAGRAEQIQLYQLSDQELLKPLRSIPTEFGGVRALAFKPFSKLPTLAFGGERGGLAVVELQRSAGVGAITRHRLEGHAHWVNSVTFSRNGFLASAGYDRKIYLWPYFNRKPMILSGHSNEIVGLDFDSEDKLHSADTRGVIARWDIKQKQLIEVSELKS